MKTLYITIKISSRVNCYNISANTTLCNLIDLNLQNSYFPLIKPIIQ